jgi:hypothetical protein
MSMCRPCGAPNNFSVIVYPALTGGATGCRAFGARGAFGCRAFGSGDARGGAARKGVINPNCLLLTAYCLLLTAHYCYNARAPSEK